MAYAGGVFTRLYNWVVEQASTPIEISKLDAQEEDFATAFNNCLLRDGTGVPSAVTPWNSKRISDLGTPTTSGDAADYVTGSFTATLTGVSGTVTGTISYKRTGHLVTLYAASSITGTSTSTAFTITGLPAACQPVWVATGLTAYGGMNSGAATGLAALILAGGSTVTFSKTITAFDNLSWTASGSKGLTSGWQMTYPVL
jgi:hypothetical protein